MGNYTELFYHFVWATRDRFLYITEDVEERLFRFMRWKCKELEVIVHALNGTSDHVHLACTLPTKLSIADFVEKIKGTSARFINAKVAEENRLGTCLYWQGGYGALTFSSNGLKSVTEYVHRQKEHHHTGNIRLKFETTFIDD